MIAHVILAIFAAIGAGLGAWLLARGMPIADMPAIGVVALTVAGVLALSRCSPTGDGAAIAYEIEGRCPTRDFAEMIREEQDAATATAEAQRDE